MYITFANMQIYTLYIYIHYFTHCLKNIIKDDLLQDSR